MNELEGMVLAHALGRLPKSIKVYFVEQKVTAYGSFSWVMPPGGPVVALHEEAAYHQVEVPISTIETPAGKIRAGYNGEVGVLFVVHVVNDPDYIHPTDIAPR